MLKRISNWRPKLLIIKVFIRKKIIILKQILRIVFKKIYLDAMPIEYTVLSYKSRIFVYSRVIFSDKTNNAYRPQNILKYKDLSDVFAREVDSSEISIAFFIANENLILKRKNLVFDDKILIFKEIDRKDRIDSYVEENFNIHYPLTKYMFKKIRLENIILIDIRWSENYYHWVLDLIPQFELIKLHAINSKKILLPRPIKEYEIESIKHFKKEYDLIFMDDKSNFELKNCYVFNTATMSGIATERKVQYIRECFIVNNEFSNKISKKLYLMRGSTQNGRRIINEIELIEKLKEYNVEAVQMDLLSFNEQISLMQSAKLVISSHGAALTNLVFTNERINVIEILTEGTRNRKWFFEISSLLKHFYYIAYGKENKDGNIFIDVDSFIMEFQKIFVL